MADPVDPLSFDELEVGREWESPARGVTEVDIEAFAVMTGDRSPIHLDPAFARSTPYRRPIAHGLLSLSLAGGLCLEAVPVRTAAFLGLHEWHFRAPVYPGDTLRVRTRVLGKLPRGCGRRGEVVWQIRVLNQDGRVVQEGVTVTLVEAALAQRRKSAA